MAHTSSHFSGKKLWLELSDLDESWLEGGHSCCQQNDNVRFGITHAQRTKRAKMCLTVYGGQKQRVVMKFGMKGEMGVADKMTFKLIANKAH